MVRGIVRQQWGAALQLLVVGFYVAFSLVIPTGIGFWLDKRAAHEFPLFTLIGLGVGTVIMIYGVYRMVRPFLQQARREGKEGQIIRPIRTFLNILPSKQKEEKDRNSD
jgi:zinc transporter ZupT